jgi:hypothetical protein
MLDRAISRSSGLPQVNVDPLTVPASVLCRCRRLHRSPGCRRRVHGADRQPPRGQTSRHPYQHVDRLSWRARLGDARHDPSMGRLGCRGAVRAREDRPRAEDRRLVGSPRRLRPTLWRRLGGRFASLLFRPAATRVDGNGSPPDLLKAAVGERPGNPPPGSLRVTATGRAGTAQGIPGHSWCRRGCLDSGHKRHPGPGMCQDIGDTLEVSDGLGPVSDRDASEDRTSDRRARQLPRCAPQLALQAAEAVPPGGAWRASSPF